MKPLRTMRGLTMTLTEHPKKLSAFKDTDDLGYFGWVWFVYGEFKGRKQYLNNVRQRFFIEDYTQCTGFGCMLKPGVVATATIVWSSGIHADDVKIAEGLVNIMTGQVGGLRQLGADGLTGQRARVVKRAGAQSKRLSLGRY